MKAVGDMDGGEGRESWEMPGTRPYTHATRVGDGGGGGGDAEDAGGGGCAKDASGGGGGGGCGGGGVGIFSNQMRLDFLIL